MILLSSPNDSIEIITFSLHLALNTCRDKGLS